jgi:hypothetical protein
MQSVAEAGAVAAAEASEEEVRAGLAGTAGRVAVAAVNGPAATVVSGDADAVEELLRYLGIGDLLFPRTATHGRSDRRLPPLRQVNSDGRVGVSGDFDMLVRVWDVRSGGQLAMLDGHDEVIAGALLTDDGHILASFDVAGHIAIWDLDWDYAFTPPPDRF